MALTLNQFIARSQIIHDDKYDYSKVVFDGSYKKVEVICPKHGSFFISPHKLWQGTGCKKCKHDKVTDNFIKKIKPLYGDNIDWNANIQYKDAKSYVQLCCTLHGQFTKHATELRKGHGCPKCCPPHESKTIEEVVQHLKTIHGERFDYSKIESTKYKDKVIIGCPVHGEFQVKLSSFIKSKNGCRKCYFDATRSYRIEQLLKLREAAKIKAEETRKNRLRIRELKRIDAENKYLEMLKERRKNIDSPKQPKKEKVKPTSKLTLDIESVGIIKNTENQYNYSNVEIIRLRSQRSKAYKDLKYNSSAQTKEVNGNILVKSFSYWYDEQGNKYNNQFEIVPDTIER